MPGRDKTGPEGNGPLTGRRLGPCNDKENNEDTTRYGNGRGRGRGIFGRRSGGRGRGRRNGNRND